MKLLEFCENVYRSDDRSYRNGINPTQNGIILMIGIVYQRYIVGMKDSGTRLPAVDYLLGQELSENNEFNARNLADLVGLVFDVVTDENRNPNLWADKAGIDSEISHTFAILFYGPRAQINQSGKGSALGNTYKEVKLALKDDLKKSYNLF